MSPPSPSPLPGGDIPAGPVASTDLRVPASALAIVAHPDDAEFHCGGTLAKWAAHGCVLNHLVLTDGSKGTWDVDVHQIGRASCRERVFLDV